MIVREVSQAWARAGAASSSAAVGLTAEMDGRGGLDIRFASRRQRPERLERAASALLGEMSERLPDPLRVRLAVEAGEVRSFLRGMTLFAREYRVASCRGAVLGIHETGGPEPFESPWTGTLDAGDLDPSLPVVLAPSAVLALVSYALEVVGGTEVPGITVVDTASSPYPPQHHPFEGDGTPSPDRILIEEGRWSGRQESGGDPVDPLFYLLTRPDRALRPLAAATHFNRRNLVVGCGRTVPAPCPAAVVDSWRVRVGPRKGHVPFHAEMSLAGANGERLALPQPMALSIDPWWLLGRIEGASTVPGPAVDEDPIEGDGYGLAPALVTGLTLDGLAAGEGPR